MSEICFGELSTARLPLETRSRGRAFGVDSLPLVLNSNSCSLAILIYRTPYLQG